MFRSYKIFRGKSKLKLNNKKLYCLMHFIASTYKDRKKYFHDWF